ncbi:MAG: hypothetical protein ABI553_09935 [Chloroflexota bacterium]
MTLQQNSVRLFVEIRATLDPQRIPAAVRAPDWLGAELAANERGMRQFACDLVLNAGANAPISFRKSMVLAAGDPVEAGSGWEIPVEWRSATMVPLFPIFVGKITVCFDRINVEGWYAPPFGAVGSILDQALMRITARATARHVVRIVAEALGGTVETTPAIVDTSPSGALR